MMNSISSYQQSRLLNRNIKLNILTKWVLKKKKSRKIIYFNEFEFMLFYIDNNIYINLIKIQLISFGIFVNPNSNLCLFTQNRKLTIHESTMFDFYMMR